MNNEKKFSGRNINYIKTIRRKNNIVIIQKFEIDLEFVLHNMSR